MRVAADTAKQHNPQCMHWMVVLHLSLEDSHTGMVFLTRNTQDLCPVLLHALHTI